MICNRRSTSSNMSPIVDGAVVIYDDLIESHHQALLGEYEGLDLRSRSDLLLDEFCDPATLHDVDALAAELQELAG